jgi:Flp pilus assembly protein TadG
MEFVMVFPAFIALTLGAINLCSLFYAASTLHFAAQKTARCIAVQNYATSPPSTGGCLGQAASFYKGPALGGLAFAQSTGGCGNTVTGSGSFTLVTGVYDAAIPISASSCYPLQS